MKRLSCELWLDGRRHTGIVRDVSELGLFVQTRAKAATGSELELAFPAEGGRAELRVVARVARRDILSAHFAVAGAGGLGLEVLESVTGLAPLLHGAGFGAMEPAPVGDANTMRPFRVRVKQLQGQRIQTIAVRAPSVHSARARALHRAGPGWKVSEVLEA